jgi:hypothetical protein
MNLELSNCLLCLNIVSFNFHTFQVVVPTSIQNGWAKGHSIASVLLIVKAILLSTNALIYEILFLQERNVRPRILMEQSVSPDPQEVAH